MAEEATPKLEKKDWRDAEIDKTEDNKKFLENKSSDTKTAIEDAKEFISTFNTEIEAIEWQELGRQHSGIAWSARSVQACQTISLCLNSGHH